MSYKRVKCIKADDTSILVEDALYTVLATTPKGNYIFWVTTTPSLQNVLTVKMVKEYTLHQQ